MITFSDRHSITLNVSDCFDPTSAWGALVTTCY